MWIIFAIVVIVVFIIGKYLIALNDQSAEIRKKGGMRKKYEILINNLISDSSRLKIFQESSNSITFGASGTHGIMLFIVTQAFDIVNIEWKADSLIRGNHQLKWNFPIYEEHYKMAEKIQSDIDQL